MKYEVHPYNYSPSDNEIIEDLQKVAKENGFSKMTMREYREHGKYDTSTISRRFGTWNKALQKANIGVSQQFWTVEQLFENIEKVWKKKGYQPTRRDMDDKNLSTISSGAYLRKFGKWSSALEQFVSYINQENTIEALDVDHIIPWSKGGETTIENLQTLCSKCNLGKSNIL